MFPHSWSEFDDAVLPGIADMSEFARLEDAVPAGPDARFAIEMQSGGKMTDLPTWHTEGYINERLYSIRSPI
jgi:hypothetical protein